MISIVTESMKCWSSMPISLLGHINVIKMNILPKFLFLFQLIPLPPPPQFFSKMKQLFTKFTWNNRRSWLRLSLLYLVYERGASQLPYLTLLIYNGISGPLKLELQRTGFHLNLTYYGYTLKVLALKACVLTRIYTLHLSKKLKPLTDNPFLRNAINVWHNVQ